MGVFMQVYKDGITRTIKNKDWQKYRELGYIEVKPVEHKPEPMEIKEEGEKLEEKPKAKK